MLNISENGKRLWIAGWETTEKQDIVQYNIYFWSIGEIKYEEVLGCMYILGRTTKKVIAVIYMGKTEFEWDKRKIEEHMNENPNLKDFSYGAEWDFSMMKIRNETFKIGALNE